MAVSQMIGARIHRREDPHLITGGGRYVEDLIRPGTLTMAVVPDSASLRVSCSSMPAIR